MFGSFVVPSLASKPSASLLEAAPLSGVSLFDGLPPACLEALEEGSELRDFPASHIFFRTGETGQRLFLLEKGRVQTFRTSGTRKLIIVDLRPPGIFGEMAFVGQRKYHCSAQTIEPSRIRIIARAQLESLLERYPVITRRLLDLVSERFLHVLLDLEAIFRHLMPRIASLLLKRAQGEWIEDVTHKEIAQHLRVYRESVSTALGELRKAGIIAVDRKRIRVVDRLRLERASRE
jgi:CRP/FNR family transcriptional regulator, cyclic AMP receptor protein